MDNMRKDLSLTTYISTEDKSFKLKEFIDNQPYLDNYKKGFDPDFDVIQGGLALTLDHKQILREEETQNLENLFLYMYSRIKDFSSKKFSINDNYDINARYISEDNNTLEIVRVSQDDVLIKTKTDEKVCNIDDFSKSFLEEMKSFYKLMARLYPQKDKQIKSIQKEIDKIIEEISKKKGKTIEFF